MKKLKIDLPHINSLNKLDKYRLVGQLAESLQTVLAPLIDEVGDEPLGYRSIVEPDVLEALWVSLKELRIQLLSDETLGIENREEIRNILRGRN